MHVAGSHGRRPEADRPNRVAHSDVDRLEIGRELQHLLLTVQRLRPDGFESHRRETDRRDLQVAWVEGGQRDLDVSHRRRIQYTR